MDPGEALSRGLARKSGEDRFEDMGQSFQEALRDGFRQLVSENAGRCHLIDGHRDPNAVAAEIAQIAVPTG